MRALRRLARRMQFRFGDMLASNEFKLNRGYRAWHGVDVVVLAGETLFAPVQGVVVPETSAYARDRALRRLVIRGLGAWSEYELTIFHAVARRPGLVREGQPVATAQNLAPRYPGMANHLHMEVRHNGALIRPFL